MWKASRKTSFLKYIRFLFDAKGKVVNSFKSNIFTLKKLARDTTSKPTPHPTLCDKPKWTKAQTKISKTKVSPFNLNQKVVNLRNILGIIAHHL